MKKRKNGGCMMDTPIDKDRIPAGPMCWGCGYLEYESDKHGKIKAHRCLAIPASKAPGRDADHQEKLDKCPKQQGV